MPAHFRGIDGLRALAILGVIAFHTRPSLLQGGFIGVTMFFVITGFLATRSVLNMVDRTGSFGYGRYLIRRITRLWPVMLATIAVVPWLTWMFAPSLLQKVVSDSLPSALFASNWVYIFRKVPYFEAAGLPSPLTHLSQNYDLQKFFHVCFQIFVDPCFVYSWEVAEMDTLRSIFIHASYQVLIDVFCHERDHRSCCLGDGYQCMVQSHVSIDLILLHSLCPETFTASSYIPVTHLIYKFLECSCCFRDLVVSQVIVYSLNSCV